jgi:hypothetical protein
LAGGVTSALSVPPAPVSGEVLDKVPVAVRGTFEVWDELHLSSTGRLYFDKDGCRGIERVHGVAPEPRLTTRNRESARVGQPVKEVRVDRLLPALHPQPRNGLDDAALRERPTGLGADQHAALGCLALEP